MSDVDADSDSKIILKRNVLAAIRTASPEKKRKLAQRIQIEMLKFDDKELKADSNGNNKKEKST